MSHRYISFQMLVTMAFSQQQLAGVRDVVRTPQIFKINDIGYGIYTVYIAITVRHQ